MRESNIYLLLFSRQTTNVAVAVAAKKNDWSIELELCCAVLQRGGEKRKKESGLIRYAVVQLTELITERPPVTGRRRRVYAILF